VIRRELKIYEGELFSQRLLDYSKNRVQALAFSRRSRSAREGSTEERIVVNLEVTERPTARSGRCWLLVV